MNVNIFKNSYFNQNWGKKVYAQKKKKKKESLAYNVYRKARNPDRFLHYISKSSILALYLHTNNYSNGFWVDIKVCFFIYV